MTEDWQSFRFHRDTNSVQDYSRLGSHNRQTADLSADFEGSTYSKRKRPSLQAGGSVIDRLLGTMQNAPNVITMALFIALMRYVLKSMAESE